MMDLHLPLAVAVSERGAVTIDSGSRTVAMSPFSERAKRLTLDFGPGTFVFATQRDVEDLPVHTLTEIVEALA